MQKTFIVDKNSLKIRKLHLNNITSTLQKIFFKKRKWIFKEFLKMELERLRVGKIKLTQMKEIFKVIAKEYKFKLFVIFNDMKLWKVKYITIHLI